MKNQTTEVFTHSDTERDKMAAVHGNIRLGVSVSNKKCKIKK